MKGHKNCEQTFCEQTGVSQIVRGLQPPRFRARQRSGEGVLQRNGCPKGCFWRVRFSSAPLSGRFQGIPVACAREFMRTLSKPGEVWRTHNTTFTSLSMTCTRVPVKVPHVHQSSGESAFCMRVAFGMCPTLRFALTTPENLKGQRRNGLSKNTRLDNRFSARSLLRSFGAPP